MPGSTTSKFAAISDLAKVKKAISPKEFLSLFSHVELMDLLFALAFLTALLKDLSDTFINFIPYVGFFLGILISGLCLIFIFLLVLFISMGKGMLKYFLVLFCGFSIDVIPLIGILPSITGTVCLIYLDILKVRKKEAEKKQQQAEQQTQLEQAVAQAYV